MTVAICVKVHDGLVFAADSAVTLMQMMVDPSGENRPVISNVYNNANKICNLFKGKPIGAMCWGSGSIGVSSISTLLKDLRARFMGTESSWNLSDRECTIKDVAAMVRKFIYEENYLSIFGTRSGPKPGMGILVGGYSSGSALPEAWQVTIDDKGECPDPIESPLNNASGVIINGQPEAACRLIFGYSLDLPEVLSEAGLDADTVGRVMDKAKHRLGAQLVPDAMPIADAIDLAEFFVYLTAMYSRFGPGSSTVGGPIESAAITKHEGFKWVKRKHYFGAELNPKI